jgi:hypothetical protein
VPWDTSNRILRSGNQTGEISPLFLYRLTACRQNRIEPMLWPLVTCAGITLNAADPSLSLPRSRSTTRLNARHAPFYVNACRGADLGDGGAIPLRIRAAIWLLW